MCHEVWSWGYNAFTGLPPPKSFSFLSNLSWNQLDQCITDNMQTNWKIILKTSHFLWSVVHIHCLSGSWHHFKIPDLQNIYLALKLLKYAPYLQGLQILSSPCTYLFTQENRSCVQQSWKSHTMWMQITIQVEIHILWRKTINNDRQLKLLLRLLMIHFFSWAGAECRILSNTKETTSSFYNDYMLHMNVTNV